MNSKKTYDILKYGSMTPDRVRDIIDLYWDDEWHGFYKSDWEIAKIDGTTESEYCETHYYKLWVYHDEKWGQVLIAFIPEFINDFPSSKWLQVALIVITIDVTDKDEDEVYDLFKQHYYELHRICEFEEYRQNFPERDI